MAAPLGLDRPGGIIVSGLHPVSPFQRAGLAVGDVIVAVNGQPVNTPSEMVYRMSVAGLGKSAEVVLLREGAERSISVDLIAAPDTPSRDTVTLPERSLLPGLTVARINPAVISEMNLPLEAEGVVVTHAGPFGPRVGLRSGDVLLSVNGVEPTHPDEIATLFGGQVRQFEMLVLRGNRRISLRFRT